MSVDREQIRTGFYQDMIRKAHEEGHLRAMSDEEREASRDEILKIDPDPDSEMVQVFAYGSLIWNPAFHYEDRFGATLEGYHRSFCLWAPIGRGTPDFPGLVLGLDQGGSCEGVVYRIRRDHVKQELDIIWAREMVAASYIPCWLDVTAADGTKSKAISFVIDCNHERYTGDVEHAETVHHIAHARGELGPCAEYLQNTITSLDFLNIHDDELFALWKDVNKAIKGLA